MIQIDSRLIWQIMQEAERIYPNECCGFLFGSIRERIKYAVQISAVKNASEDAEQYHRFIITPEQMLAAERYARSHHLDIVGFYHSHPDCAAVPSEYDTAHALPVYSYLIVSVRSGKAGDCRSWELDSAADYTAFGSEPMIHPKGET